jgi:membrane-bound ClpP family serine protease
MDFFAAARVRSNKQQKLYATWQKSELFAIYQELKKELVMGIGTILIIVLILLLIGGLPVFPHSRSWGYGPSGIIGTILVILLILVLLGRI